MSMLSLAPYETLEALLMHSALAQVDSCPRESIASLLQFSSTRAARSRLAAATHRFMQRKLEFWGSEYDRFSDVY